MKSSYPWTVDHLYRARQLHWRHSVRNGFNVVLYAVLALSLAYGLMILFEDGALMPGLLFVFVPIYSLAFRPWYQKWAARRHFLSRPDAGVTITTEFEDAVVRSSTTLGDRGESPWAAFHKAVVGKDGVLIYHNPQIFHWYPKESFESQEDFQAFLELVRTKISRHYVA
jgi:hypothetical protein